MSGVKPLRPYQEECISLIVAEIRKGCRAVCFTLSTGLGKSRIIAEICKRHLAKVPNAKILLVAHRTELIGQLYDEMVGQGLCCGVIQAVPVREVNPRRPVQIGSIQTLLARKIDVEGVTLFINDECHHAPSKTYIELPNHYKKNGALILGATATPIRSDGVGLGDIYEALVQPLPMKDAIAQGFLVPYQLIRPERQLESKQIATKPVDAYLAHAKGRKAAVFAMNINAANHFKDEFIAAGIPTGVVTGTMPGGDRARALASYAQGDLRVLISVGVLSEGWDDPPTSCVILARSIGSVGWYLQAVGRALRLSPGKKDAVILDLGGSSHTHGAPDDDREWSLEGDGLAKKEASPLLERFCSVCGVLVEVDAPICPGCGIAKPEMVAPEVVNARLVKFAKKLAEGPDKRAATLARWLDEARKLNHKRGKALHRYRGVYGTFPPPDIVKAAERINLTDRLS